MYQKSPSYPYGSLGQFFNISHCQKSRQKKNCSILIKCHELSDYNRLVGDWV